MEVSIHDVLNPHMTFKTKRWALTHKEGNCVPRNVHHIPFSVLLCGLWDVYRRAVGFAHMRDSGCSFSPMATSVGCRSPPLQSVFLKNRLEEFDMSKYQNSDYALNKYSEGIVYRFADGVKEITLSDYLLDNPGKTQEDFAELKALSDGIYYEQDRADSAQTRNDLSIHGMEEMNCCATRPLEDELMERYVEIRSRRYARQAVRALLEGRTLTEIQRRRFCLHIFQGRSTRQIARLEGISFQNVAKSINLAIQKLKKLFDEQG